MFGRRKGDEKPSRSRENKSRGNLPLLGYDLGEEEAACALRLSLAHLGTPDATTPADVDACARAVSGAYAALRGLAV